MASETLHFENARLAQQLFNGDPQNLSAIERELNVRVIVFVSPNTRDASELGRIQSHRAQRKPCYPKALESLLKHRWQLATVLV